MTQGGTGYLARPAPSGLADVIEIILGRGLVLDAYVRVALLGIELLTLDARFVVASVDTYLRFAEATNRLDLLDNGPPNLVEGLKQGAETMIENVASSVVEDKVQGALGGVGDALGEPAKKVAQTAGRKAIGVAENIAKKAGDSDQG